MNKYTLLNPEKGVDIKAYTGFRREGGMTGNLLFRTNQGNILFMTDFQRNPLFFHTFNLLFFSDRKPEEKTELYSLGQIRG